MLLLWIIFIILLLFGFLFKVSVSFNRFAWYQIFRVRFKLAFLLAQRSGINSNGIAPDTNTISGEWFRTNNVSLGNSVPPLRAEFVEKVSGGLMANLRRYKVVYRSEDDDKHNAQGVSTFLIKQCNSGEAAHFRSVLYENSREARFYRAFVQNADKTNVFPTPKIYFTSFDESTGEFLIMMEDLQNTVLLSYPLGNQCWGEPDLTKLPFQVDQRALLSTVFHQVASFHARYWGEKGYARLCTDIGQPPAWFKHAAFLSGQDRTRFEVSLFNACSQWSDLKRPQTFRADYSVVWDPLLVSVMDSMLTCTNWSTFIAQYGSKEAKQHNITLTHGDHHAANMLYNYLEKKVYMVDWSEIGFGYAATELAQLLVSNATPELRREHEQSLLDEYYTQLCKENNEIETLYPKERFMFHYKVGGIERWLQMLLLMARWNLSSTAMLSDKVIQWFHDQTLAFIQDHYDEATMKDKIFLTTIYRSPGH